MWSVLSSNTIRCLIFYFSKNILKYRGKANDCAYKFRLFFFFIFFGVEGEKRKENRVENLKKGNESKI